MNDLPDTHDGSTNADETTMEDIFGDGDAAAPDPQPDQTETTEPMSDTHPTTDETTRNGAMSGPNEYDPIELYDHMLHRQNGDETAVLLCAFGDGYQAIAVDVAEDGELLEVEDIGHLTNEDYEKAEGIAEYWVQQNPKGILGGEPDEEGGGFLAKLGFGGDGE